MEKSARKELEKNILEVSKSISDMLASLTDTSTLIRNSTWAVGDAAAHLVISQRLFRDVLRGEKSPYGDGKLDVFAEVNDRFLKSFTDKKGSSLAEQLLKGTKDFLEEASTYSDKQLFKTHFGRMELTDCMRYCLCHLLMHGSDIAMALSKNIPVNQLHVKQILPFFKKGMSERYDKEAASKLNLSIDINVKGTSRFAVICNKGVVKVEGKIPSIVDCHVLIDPITFFLVSTGIISLWKPLFMGKIVIWGRKPWLALQLKTLFPNP